MKKIISLLLVFAMIIPFLTGCGKEETWSDDNYGEIKDDVEMLDENVDLNLEGKLYTEENKPEGSVPIYVYTLEKENLKIEKHTSYAIPEKINIQYLLDTLTAFSADKEIKITGYVVDNVATVNIDNTLDFVAWLAIRYPGNTEKYLQTPENFDGKDVEFHAEGFAMAAMETIDRTLKENLSLADVVFKTNNDEEFLVLSEDCTIEDGIYFTEDSSPKYLGSIYNYIGEADFKTIVEDYSSSIPNLKEKTEEEQREIINQFLY